MTKPANIDEYIAGFSPEIQTILEKLRATVNQAAPDAVEIISYGMPAFKLHGKILLYFAAHTNHIGLYPMAATIVHFNPKLADYKISKGTVQFRYNQPLPIELIAAMVKFRNAEIMQKAALKKK